MDAHCEGSYKKDFGASNALASSVFLSLPTFACGLVHISGRGSGCTIEVILLAFVDESSNPSCWALKPYMHPLHQRQALGSLSPAPCFETGCKITYTTSFQTAFNSSQLEVSQASWVIGMQRKTRANNTLNGRRA